MYICMSRVGKWQDREIYMNFYFDNLIRQFKGVIYGIHFLIEHHEGYYEII